MVTNNDDDDTVLFDFPLSTVEAIDELKLQINNKCMKKNWYKLIENFLDTARGLYTSI